MFTRRSNSCNILRTLKKIPNQPQTAQTIKPQKGKSFEALYGETVDKSLGLNDLLSLLNPSPQCRYNRAKMIDWMLQVICFFMNERGWQCYFTSLSLLDRYLISVPTVQPEEIHEIGLTCIFISMKYTSFVHPSLKSLLKESCDTKFTVKQIEKREIQILQKIEYLVQPLKLYQIINRIVGHPLVENQIRQIGAETDKVLEKCYRKMVELYLHPKCSSYSYLEIAYAIIKIALEEIWSCQGFLTKSLKSRVMTLVSLCFRVQNKKSCLSCYNQICALLTSSRSKYCGKGAFCYQTIRLSMHPLAK